MPAPLQIDPKLHAYLNDRYAADLAAGWFFATRGRVVILCRMAAKGEPAETRDVPLPAHMRPCRDAEAWHAEHQSGGLFNPGGLFAEPEHTQTSLF